MSTQQIDYRTLVEEAEGEDIAEREHPAYEFSKKTFYENDKAGVYGDEPAE